MIPSTETIWTPSGLNLERSDEGVGGEDKVLIV